MRTLLNPLMMVNKYEKLFVTPGTYSLTLSPGRYSVVCRGGGGSGGTNGTGGGHGGTAGVGGAGAKGDLTTSTLVVSTAMLLNIVVGAGGLTRGNGGNGGMGGGRGNRQTGGAKDGINGCGGGGGRPSYVITNPTSVTEYYYGWQHTLTGAAKYTGVTKTYYVTYDSPETIYISETEHTYTLGGFVMENGTTYTDGQQILSASDESVTVSINISIVGNTVTLVGTVTDVPNASVIPVDVSGDFINTVDVLTKSASPAVGDTVYNLSFVGMGTITSIGTDFIEYDGNMYLRYGAIDTSRQTQISSQVFYANGGGGGGGGGSGAIYGRYSGGAGGGGGGGYYYFDTTNNTVVAIDGRDGANGGTGWNPRAGGAGVNGNTAQFPSLYSGNGIGWNNPGGAGASGGGASGGGGGYGAGNEGDAWGGGGGGGAGGSADAGGGSGGYGNPGGYAGNGSNYHTTPTAVADENANIGVIGNYGLGGTSGQNGNSGFVYVKRVAWS